MKKELANRNIINLPPLPVGSPAERVQHLYGTEHPAQLCYNECAEGVSPKAIEAMRNAANSMNLYPEPSSEKLRERLAMNYGVMPSEIILSNGMDNILQMICHAFINEGETVLTCGPTFGAYSFGAAMSGAKYVQLPLIDNRFDLDGILNAIDASTKLVFICNPNNPTGTVLKHDAVASFMKNVPEHVVVVFDEAYAEFVEDADYANGMDYVHAGRNVIVGRTFSKIYGLAGCRVGYVLAREEIMGVLRKAAETFPVNGMAQAAALAAFDDVEFLQLVKQKTTLARNYLIAELSALNMNCTESAGNFIWVDSKHDGVELMKQLEEKGFIIRAGFGAGYENYLRIGIGTMAQNEALVAALKELCSK